MPKSPKVSIVIPNFNKLQHVRETLVSVQSQAFSDWEAVVVDDGSSDGSDKIIQEFVERDPRFRFYRTPDGPIGGGRARNQGAFHSCGEFLMFLDSDDVISADCLATRLEQISGSNDDFQVWPGATFLDVPGDRDFDESWRPCASDDHLKAFLRHRLPWNISAPIWRKSFFESIGGFDSDLKRLQDVELHVRTLLSRPRYIVHEDSLPDFFYRISPDRQTFSHLEMARRYVESVLLFIEKTKMSIDLLTTGDRRKRQLEQWLLGTLISILARVELDTRMNFLTEDDRLAFVSQLLEDNCIRNLGGRWRSNVVGIISKFRLLGFRRIPRITTLVLAR